MTEKEPLNQGTGETMDINTDESVSGSTHLNEPVANEDEIEKLKAEVQELKEKYLRQAAEFDNFRKRTAKERLELIQTAGKDVIVSLLEVLDDSDRAEKQLQTSNCYQGGCEAGIHQDEEYLAGQRAETHAKHRYRI
jgi:molecular chaperone GrpE